MLDANTWKIWFETFNEKGEMIGAGVMPTEYRTEGYAKRQAARCFANKPNVKYTVSQTNPWQGK